MQKGLIAAGDVSAIMLYGGLLILALVALGAAVWWLRRRYMAEAESSVDGVWSLQQLRDLRAKGELSEAEFQSLRAEMLGRHALRTAAPAGSTNVDAEGPDEGNEIKESLDDSR